MTVTKRDHSTKRTPTMVGPSAVMDRGKSWIETPSRINFDSNVLSVGQRYDYPIGIKDGLRTKKVKPTYNPDAAPVYDPGFEKSDREMLDDDAASMKPPSKRLDLGKRESSDELLSPAKVGFIVCSAILSLLLGVASFVISVIFILRPLDR